MPARYLVGLKCEHCSNVFGLGALDSIKSGRCEYDFGHLEAYYDFSKIKWDSSRESIQNGTPDIWRYINFLPISGSGKPASSVGTGYTPLVKADRLAKIIGVEEIYIKDDTVNPTGSFKDRGVEVATAVALELGYNSVACVSTGNLAKSTAAQAKKAGLKSYIFVPADLEQEKIAEIAAYSPFMLIGIKGSYDDVNGLGTKIVGKHPEIAFVNINFRPFYGDGSKTMGFEIAEQLGWRAPADIIAPVGGALLISKVAQGFKELYMTGLIGEPKTRIHAAQSAGCAPVSNAILSSSRNIKPVPRESIDTIASSIAIGNPSNGNSALGTIRNSGGYAAAVSNEEIIRGMRLIEETEGIQTEEVGGVVVASLERLLKQGKIPKNGGPIVLLMTGHKHETPLGADTKSLTAVIESDPAEFDRILKSS